MTITAFNFASRARVPWALIAAIAIVVGVDAWMRSWSIEHLTAYRDGNDQAAAVRTAIDLGSTPDVAIVGSSMAYQGIAIPELKSALSTALGRPVMVGNFAVRGGRVDLFDAVIRDVLRGARKPRVIVVGISMRDLREHGVDSDRLSQFWSSRDLGRESRQAGSFMSEQLPQVIRNEIGRFSVLMRCRTALAMRAEGMFIDPEIEPMPALGERPSQHIGGRRDQTLADAIDEFNRPTSKRRMIAAYRPELGARPPKVLSDRVTRIIDACRRAGVGLIFVDLPLSRPLRDLMESAQRKTRTRDASHDFDVEYRRLMRRVTAKAHVPFLEGDALGVTWEDADFFDAQHLNLGGAVKLTTAITPPIAAALGGR